jgi:lipopolysaccharide transport system permease protein
MYSSLRKNSFTNYKDLLFAWTSRIIRARYQQSILGGLWAVLQPIATVLIFTLVFSYFLKVDTGNVPYIVFSYTAMVPWLFFSTSVNEMVDSIVSNMNLVSKIYFPREILVFSTLLARLLDFLIAFILVIVLIIIYRMPINLINWLFIPALLLCQIALALGIGFLASALNTFFRDIKHVFTLIMQLWMYATPIIYPITLVPDRLKNFYFLNPMVGIIQGYRAILLYREMPDISFLFSMVISLVILLLGYAFFKKVESNFADII